MDDIDAPEVGIDTRVTETRTVIDVNGTRDMAVIVRSESGERIYLPPESFDEPLDDSPYASPYTSPYGGDDPRDGDGTPYRGAVETTRGVIETADGFRIRHPEPVTQIDVYREN